MQEHEYIRIALVEDNLVSRKSFFQKAEMIDEWKIVFSAENSEDCLEKLSSLKENMLPQVIFMDIEMPGVNGIQTIAIAKSIYPQIYFIALTVFDDEEKVVEEKTDAENNTEAILAETPAEPVDEPQQIEAKPEAAPKKSKAKEAKSEKVEDVANDETAVNKDDPASEDNA